MIAVPTCEMAKHSAFYDYFNLLQKPEGTVVTLSHGQSPASGRNTCIEQALEHDCTHILFIDDDMVFPPDALYRLLKHDVDIVSGYYLMRQYPHQGLIFDQAEPSGECRWYEVEDNESGLREVVAAGLGFVLFRTSVFEALEKPYVRLGELESCRDGWCDDIGLFKRVREAGFKIHMDLDLRIGHISSMVVTPMHKDGFWYVEIGTFTPETVAFPMVRKPKPAAKEMTIEDISKRLGEIIQNYGGMESNIPVDLLNPHEYWTLKRQLTAMMAPK
jgi:glycosyltransferase involved in cell wall biosynthesis